MNRHRVKIRYTADVEYEFVGAVDEEQAKEWIDKYCYCFMTHAESLPEFLVVQKTSGAPKKMILRVQKIKE